MVIRKSIRMLTATEKADYIRGVKLLKNDNGRYDNFIQVHSNNYQSIHGGPIFLPWHRKLILSFEKELQIVLGNSNFGLPYWDWEWDGYLEDPSTAPIWDKDFMGGNGVPQDGYLVDTGPFIPGQWMTYPNFPTSPNGLRRDFGNSYWNRNNDNRVKTLPRVDEADFIISAVQFYDTPQWDVNSKNSLRNYLEGWESFSEDYSPPRMHNRVHAWIGGHMAHVPISVNDPVFFLHHSNVDRMWAMWQLKHPNASYPETGPRNGQRLNDPMVFWNITPKEVLNHIKLGYQYQIDQLIICFENSGLPLIMKSTLIPWLNAQENWRRADDIPNVGITDSPSLAVFNGTLYCAHQGSDNCGQLFVTTYDGNYLSGWGPDNGLHVGITGAPSLAVYNKKLYCAHQGSNNCGVLWIASMSDDGKWSDTELRVGITGSPSLAVYNKKLYCAHQGSNGVLWIASMSDGEPWHDAELGAKITGSPALAVFNQKLYCIYEGEENCGQLYMKTFNGDYWDKAVPLPIGTTDGPGLAVFNDKLYCVHRGSRHNENETTVIFCASTNNGSDWKDDEVVGLGFQTTSRPAIVNFHTLI